MFANISEFREGGDHEQRSFCVLFPLILLMLIMPSCSLRLFLLAKERMDCRSASQKMSQLTSLVARLGTAGDIYFNRRITTERPENGDIFTEL